MRIHRRDRQGTGSFGAPDYSRSEGIASYRRRRRRGITGKVFVSVILIAIIGSAAFLMGRQYLDYSSLPFEVPGATTQEPAQEEVFTQPAQVRVVVAGDVIMNGAVVSSGRASGDTYDFAHLFSHLTREIMPNDLRILSQETALAGSNYGFGNDWGALNAPQELGRAEVEAGFNVILRATDHSLDTWRDGIHTELLWWRSYNAAIPVLGIAEPNKDDNPGLGNYVDDVYIFEKEGLKVAVLNHTIGIGEDNADVVSCLTEEKIAADVQKARDAGAAFIVACPHWGNENSNDPSDEQREFARYYASLGVDVIVGTHPRVLQPVEVLDGPDGHKTVCYYSIGCTISSLDKQNLVGGLAEFSLIRDASGNYHVDDALLKPVVTHRGEGESYTTYLLADYTETLSANSWDPDLTPEELDSRCTSALGTSYSRYDNKLVVDLTNDEGAESAAEEESVEETAEESAEEL